MCTPASAPTKTPQLATVKEAGCIFQEEAVPPALGAPAGVGQLVALCDAFCEHLRRRAFPGGCFFADTAIAPHELAADEKPELVAFEVDGIILAADTTTCSTSTWRARGRPTRDPKTPRSLVVGNLRATGTAHPCNTSQTIQLGWNAWAESRGGR